ncbi:hypothetical protein PR048_006351 [Dryococelus australis]|uniref:PiggyBac transposable element-derived protein domain-containing protein n=1 Tax=Dryococelus australis TaxID=614101 RepID=A0ABQ9IBR8_9NEOP|nr:hypothetical protein PR048_006351 [Dryococelus australis]
MMIPFKGRSKMKQFKRGKPKRWGFNVWVSASYSGYIQCFEIYSGKDKNLRSTLDVLRLCHDIKSKNHKLFVDNLFTSFPMIRQLEILRMNRVPEVAAKLVPGKLFLQGCLSVATSDGCATRKCTPFLLLQVLNQKRWYCKVKDVVIPLPFSVGDYNIYMGCVDLADRMIVHYPHGLKSKKLYYMPFVTFKASIAHALIVLGRTDVKKSGRESSSGSTELPRKRALAITVIPQVRFDQYEH